MEISLVFGRPNTSRKHSGRHLGLVFTAYLLDIVGPDHGIIES